MLRTEDEISRRWPNLADRYDRLADNPANLALRWHPQLRTAEPIAVAQPSAAAVTLAATLRRSR